MRLCVEQSRAILAAGAGDRGALARRIGAHGSPRDVNRRARARDLVLLRGTAGPLRAALCPTPVPSRRPALDCRHSRGPCRGTPALRRSGSGRSSAVACEHHRLRAPAPGPRRAERAHHAKVPGGMTSPRLVQVDGLSRRATTPCTTLVRSVRPHTGETRYDVITRRQETLIRRDRVHGAVRPHGSPSGSSPRVSCRDYQDVEDRSTTRR